MFPSKKVQTIVGLRILVEMKGDSILEGILCSVDDYMNLCLSETVEISEDGQKRELGTVVLRGDNIILMTPVAD